MTPMIPAVLLWYEADPQPVQLDTEAPAHMCSPVDESAALLRQGKPALIRVEDVPAVLAALEHACEAAAAPTGTAQGAQ